MKKIKKAIIPVAGLGTRFLPATKTVPKELLPIVDKPTLLYNIEEAVKSGVEDIILITGRGKSAIEDFFDTSYELEDQLIKNGKEDLLKKITDIKNMANIISIRQKEALGLGHAVLTGHNVIGKEPFALLLGDEIIYNDSNQDTATQQLCKTWNNTGISIVSIMKVPESEVHKYGIVKIKDSSNSLMQIEDVIEKPSKDLAPSLFALPGRYVFDGKIFDYLKETKPGKNGEIQLTDAMTQIAQKEGLNAMVTNGLRYDAGDKLGYLIANIEYGLRHPEIGSGLKEYLQSLNKKL